MYYFRVLDDLLRFVIDMYMDMDVGKKNDKKTWTGIDIFKLIDMALNTPKRCGTRCSCRPLPPLVTTETRNWKFVLPNKRPKLMFRLWRWLRIYITFSDKYHFWFYCYFFFEGLFDWDERNRKSKRSNLSESDVCILRHLCEVLNFIHSNVCFSTLLPTFVLEIDGKIRTSNILQTG